MRTHVQHMYIPKLFPEYVLIYLDIEQFEQHYLLQSTRNI